MISQVYHAQTNDLFSLAKLTDLDPNQDLAGGSLLGMELSGVQWGGANLYHINLRGANLTDADLSEANLSYAKLSGADLSGAYLGSANLSYAHLNKASLALSNLIGANLEGANLEGANLSNANFSGAIVLGAQFGNNVGMTEEMQQSLRARGAKIPEWCLAKFANNVIMDRLGARSSVDRAPDSGSVGRGFKSLRARGFENKFR